MKRRQKGKIAKNKFFSLIGSQRKLIKPDIPLLFVAYFFAIWPTYFCWIYKLFSYPLTIRCLLFSWKITLKIESLQFIYLILLLMSWELFRQKLAIMRKINIMGVVFKLPRVSIWDAVRDIWRCNTATSFSFGVLSPSGELQTKKWSQ